MKIQKLVKATIIACQSIGIATFALFPSTVFAQIKPDSRGDYYSWVANWIVVDSGSLNCRSGPGSNYRIETKFSRASQLYTFSELEGNPIRRDSRGLPWARIKWANARDTLPCYVRANTSFIRPIDSFTSEQIVCIKSGLRKGLNFNNAAYSCVG